MATKKRLEGEAYLEHTKSRDTIYTSYSIDPVSELYECKANAGSYDVKILDVESYELAPLQQTRKSRASKVAAILLGIDTEGCGFYTEQVWHRIPIEKRHANNHYMIEHSVDGMLEINKIYSLSGYDKNTGDAEDLVGHCLTLNLHTDNTLSWLKSDSNTKPETGEATMKTQMKALATMMMADENLVHTVKVVFQDNAMDFTNNGLGIYKDNSKRYCYKAATDMNIEEGDLVVVDVSSHDKQSLKVVKVVAVDEGVDIEMERDYKWVLGKIDLTSFERSVQLEKQVEVQLEDKKKKAALRQAKEALLGEIGADSLTALIGRDKKES